jgi:hypothetical protein
MQPIMSVRMALEAFRNEGPAVCQSTNKEYTLPPASLVFLDMSSPTMDIQQRKIIDARVRLPILCRPGERGRVRRPERARHCGCR